MFRISVLAVALAMLATMAPAQAQMQALRTITVTGEGRVEAVPDMAVVTLGVEQQADTAAAALDAMSRAMRAIMQRLEGAGVAERDIQTTGLNLNQVWDHSNNQPRVIGFSASSTLQVRVREIGAVGGLLDQLVGAGANQLQGIAFDIADRSALEAEARRLAVGDAQARAQDYAAAAGVTLGPIRSISDAGAPVMPPQPMFRAEAMNLGAVPVAGGEMTLTHQVTVVFALE